MRAEVPVALVILETRLTPGTIMFEGRLNCARVIQRRRLQESRLPHSPVHVNAVLYVIGNLKELECIVEVPMAAQASVCCSAKTTTAFIREVRVWVD